jgi:hypothetical protein
VQEDIDLQFVRVAPSQIIDVDIRAPVGFDRAVPNNSVRRDIPGQNSQTGGKCQYKIFSQEGYSSTQYLVRRDIPV